MTCTRASGPTHRSLLALALGLALLPISQAASAQDRMELERLRSTTQALIDVLVENGLLTRDKAQEMIAKARQSAEAQSRAQALAQAQAQIQGRSPADATQAEVGADGKRVVRVPYVPESVRNEMREQIRQDVLAQARNERWGEPGALPAWANKLQIEGDVRMREEVVRLPSSNTPPGPGGVNWQNGRATRAADVVQSTANGASNFNTQQNFDRQRVRARLGLVARINDAVSTGLRVATGNQASSTTRSTNNQTLGQGFNNYSATFDQAWVAVSLPRELGAVTAGRMRNPFFGTDLVWADDLAFEGIALSSTRQFRGATGFLAAGWFPLSENRPGTSSRRSLTGLQAGLETALARSGNRLKVGAALYAYQGLQGQREDLAALNDPTYGTRYEYAGGLRQRGNTLFNVRAAGDPSATAIYGLASSFRELNVTAQLDLPDLLPVHTRLTADFVSNLAYSGSEVRARTGLNSDDGSSKGVLLRAQFGKPQIERARDWNTSVTWRHLGSDAVLDAFTSADFGLGGTNTKGYTLAFNYGLYDATSLGVRWMSSSPVASFAPGSATPTRFSTDVIQLDLAARF